MKTIITLLVLALGLSAHALDYPHVTAEPQKTGWPLTAEERAYVLKPEFERRPGSEQHKHLPPMWPVTPSAGNWGGTSWLDTHERLVDYVKANSGPCDVLLVGDSITQQWGSPLDKGVLNEAWKKHFASYRTINVGIGGDKSQNVLWRVDHGGVEGLQPKVVIVMVGNNNMFFAPETGVEAAAKGVQMLVANVREKFPQAEVISARILPCHAPGNAFHENIKKTNAALDALKLDGDPKVHVLDLTNDFLNADGTLKKALFGPDNIHLSLAGYAVYAGRLKPLLDKFLGGKGLGGDVVMPAKKISTTAPASTPSPSPRSAETTAPAALKPGDTAPKLRVGAWVKGEPITELARDKACLVDFWATWCAPCVAMVPHLNELHLKFKDKGLVVVGQAVSKDDQAKVRPFCEKMGEKMSYRVAPDDFSASDRGAMAEVSMMFDRL